MKAVKMFKLIFIVPFVFLMVPSFAAFSSFETVIETVIDGDEGGITFEFASTDVRLRALVSSMEFNKKHNQIDIETKKEIQFIEFTDRDGQVIFKVPIGADNMHIGVSTYPKGTYFIKMMLSGEKEFVVTKVMKEF